MEEMIDGLIDNLIEKLQGLKKKEPEKRRKIYIDGTLFFILDAIEENNL